MVSLYLGIKFPFQDSLLIVNCSEETFIWRTIVTMRDIPQSFITNLPAVPRRTPLAIIFLFSVHKEGTLSRHWTSLQMDSTRLNTHSQQTLPRRSQWACLHVVNRGCPPTRADEFGNESA